MDIDAVREYIRARKAELHEQGKRPWQEARKYREINTRMDEVEALELWVMAAMERAVEPEGED